MNEISKKDFKENILSFTRNQRNNFDEDFGDLSSHQLRALFTYKILGRTDPCY